MCVRVRVEACVFVCVCGGGGSPRLHAAFTNFKQACDTNPRDVLWKSLRRTHLPASVLSVIQDV